MRLSLGQNMQMAQKQVLAPRMIQSMEILQLPIMALQERIQQELQENPVLELRETTPEESATEEEVPAAPAEPEDATDPAKELVIDKEGDTADFDRLEAMSRDWDDVFNEESRMSRNGRWVAFATAADLVPGDTNGIFDAFVRDRTTGTTTRVSLDGTGAQEVLAAGECSCPLDAPSVAWSPDDRFVLAGDAGGDLYRLEYREP